MEAMYQEYKDIVEFRLIYIREAHPLDSHVPMDIAKEKNILQHKSYEERCVTAEMLMADQELTMPMLIDGMNNGTNDDYSAYPDRVFLVRTDGRLGVASRRGPSGFGPGLDQVEDWLANFRENGREPRLTRDAIRKADAMTNDRIRRKRDYDVQDIEIIAGTWHVRNIYQDNATNHQITFSTDGEKTFGEITVGDQEIVIDDLRFQNDQFSFSLEFEDATVEFIGQFTGKHVRGEFMAGDRTYVSVWSRLKTTKPIPRQRQRVR